MRKVGFSEFVWIWNKTQGFPTPALHVEIARWLATAWERGERELLLLAFRNSGKSTLVGLFCAWLLYRKPNLRILVLAGDFPLARKMVSNARRIVERHPLTQRLKPTHTEAWAADQFTVRREAELRDSSMLAKGITSNITGLRADVVICDDVEVPNTCDSPPKRSDLRTRLREIEYILVPEGMQLFVGTPHTYYSIYSQSLSSESEDSLPLLSNFHRLEIPLLDQHGVSQWPERFPLDRIDAIRLRTGPAKFESQMLLRPRNILEGRLDPERLKRYAEELVHVEGNSESLLTLRGRRLVSASCWWDPSFGAPERGDASVIAVVFTDAEGECWLHRVRYLTHDPSRANEIDEATQLCRQVADFIRGHYLPVVVIETNGIGRFLPRLLQRELRALGYPCAVHEHVSHRNKDLRIIDGFDALLAAGRLHAHDSVWATPFIEEMREWRPASGARDDGLDAIAGCLLSEPVRLPRLVAGPGKNMRNRPNWMAATSAIAAAIDFEL